MAKAMTKSKIVATLAEKVGITKKQAAAFLEGRRTGVAHSLNLAARGRPRRRTRPEDQVQIRIKARQAVSPRGAMLMALLQPAGIRGIQPVPGGVIPVISAFPGGFGPGHEELLHHVGATRAGAHPRKGTDPGPSHPRRTGEGLGGLGREEGRGYLL